LEIASMSTLEQLEGILTQIGFGTRDQAIIGLVDEARDIIRAASSQSATVQQDPAPQSSVEIETMAKGAPKVTVKVYDANPWQARQTAMQMYDDTVNAYTTPAPADQQGDPAHEPLAGERDRDMAGPETPGSARRRA
jgi:hypothetical protein